MEGYVVVKKLLSCALIISMLSTTGAMCFAQEGQESINPVENVVAQIESTEELNEIAEKIETEIEMNDQLKEEIELLSKEGKEEKSICGSSIKSWLLEKIVSPVGKMADILVSRTVVALCNAVLTMPLIAVLRWLIGLRPRDCYCDFSDVALLFLVRGLANQWV